MQYIEWNVIPTALKNAKVVPLPKTNDLSDPSYCRPISLLHVIHKPPERNIHKHSFQYLENSKLIYQYQSGFRPNYSCLTALTRLSDGCLSGINCSEIEGAVFLDCKNKTKKTLLILWITLFSLGSCHFNSKTIHLSLFFMLIIQKGQYFSFTTSHHQRDQ